MGEGEGVGGGVGGWVWVWVWVGVGGSVGVGVGVDGWVSEGEGVMWVLLLSLHQHPPSIRRHFRNQ